MSRDIISKLKTLKTDPRAGWVGDDVRARRRAQLMEAIGGDQAEVVANQGALAYYRWSAFNFVSKPIAVGTMMMVLVLGGITTVNAASSSLPGDTLYNVKLVSERAQLKIASLENKAVLHSEFAQRRLDEAMALGSDPSKSELVGPTLEAFRKEMELAQNELRRLQEASPVATVAAANQINKNLNEVSDSIDQDNSSVETADQARDFTQAAADTVVDIVVETHENTADQTSAKELENLFQEEVNELRARQTFDLGRLVVIQNVFESNEAVAAQVEVVTGLNVMEHDINQSSQDIYKAMDIMAAGGYRTAFEMLRSVREDLLEIESQLANIEIGITAVLAESPEEDIQESGEVDGEVTAEVSEEVIEES